jgi:hypothetical protein
LLREDSAYFSAILPDAWPRNQLTASPVGLTDTRRLANDPLKSPTNSEQRQIARQAAHEAVVQAIGVKPTREQFTYTAVSKYPPAITHLISGLCLVLLLAAFTPSAIRLYVIGSRTFGQAVSNEVAPVAVGLATVLSAEVGQVVFSLALATCRFQRNIGMEYGETPQNHLPHGRKIPV